MSTPASEHVPELISQWNEVHNPKYDSYTTGRMYLSRNGINHDNWPRERVIEALKIATQLLEDHPDDWDVVADVYCFFDNIQRIIPDVPAWIVWKIYRDADWRDAVWSGWRTEAEAQEDAKAAQKKYGSRDKFVVSFGRCHISYCRVVT